MIKKGWVPHFSPYGLLQESLWPNEWAILVSCIMLNCTSRKQVEKILPDFLKCWSTPQSFLNANINDVIEKIKPLGFSNRRAKNLTLMSQRYVSKDWHHAKELPGIGDYGSRAWEIFCRDILGDEPPVDHALVNYWDWRKDKNRK